MSADRGPGRSPSLEEVKDSLRRLLEENAGIPAEAIEDGATLDGDLAMDSFSFVSVQVALEETFGIELGVEELEECREFDAIARRVAEKVRGETGSHGRARPPAPAPIPLAERRRSSSGRV